ncbi:MAG: AMP-binding protein [Deltaproteobacteria bacterium]|nr:AMP-binding protein [Deltaproteobacteria bacterium]
MAASRDRLSLPEAARRWPEAPALVLAPEGSVWSFGALAEALGPVCGWLAGSVGPVALVADNTLEAALVLHALVALGTPVVPLHPRLTPPERDALVRDSGATLVLTAEALAARPWEGHGPRWSASSGPLPGAPLGVLYTSGTSGRPKGAVLSRRAFVASARASGKNLGWARGDRWVLCLPLCHVGGLSVLTRCLLAGRAVVLHPRFDADAVLASLREGGTLLSVVPTMLRALLGADHAGDLRRARAILVGGASCPEALLRECSARGVRALATYGLTEACSQVTCEDPSEALLPGARRSSGRPLPGVSLRVLGEDGQEAPRGVVGALEVRGPTLFSGYLHQAPRGDGWFSTGDLGALDARGRLTVYARRTDLVVTGGENVYPLEVEAALEGLEGVREALVFGIPDEVYGQRVACALVLDGGEPDAVAEAGLWARLEARLARHKRPRSVLFVDALPRLPSGKPDRAGAAEALGPRCAPWRR